MDGGLINEDIKAMFSDHRLDPELYDPHSDKCCFEVKALARPLDYFPPDKRIVIILRKHGIKWKDIRDFLALNPCDRTMQYWLCEQGKYIKD